MKRVHDALIVATPGETSSAAADLAHSERPLRAKRLRAIWQVERRFSAKTFGRYVGVNATNARKLLLREEGPPSVKLLKLPAWLRKEIGK